MKKASITFTRSMYAGMEVISLQFIPRQDTTFAVRRPGYARYEPVTGVCCIPASTFRLPEVFKAPSPVTYLDYSVLKDVRVADTAANPHATETKRDSDQPGDATLMLEKGVDIRYIQEMHGHASSRTTDIYTHVTETSIRTSSHTSLTCSTMTNNDSTRQIEAMLSHTKSPENACIV